MKFLLLCLFLFPLFAIAQNSSELFANTNFSSSIAVEKPAKQSIRIPDYSFQATDSTIRMELTLVNSAKATIKNVWITVEAYDAANEVIATTLLQLSGPITYKMNSFYTIENLFPATVFHSGKLVAVKIEYLNRRIKKFTGENIDQILIDQPLLNMPYALLQ